MTELSTKSNPMKGFAWFGNGIFRIAQKPSLNALNSAFETCLTTRQLPKI